MGNYANKNFQGGYLFIKTENPTCFPGNLVQGKIYIRTEVPMEAKHVEVKVDGMEKISYHRNENKIDKKGQKTYEETVKIKRSKKIF
jgi:hypothetical protein